MDPSSQESFPSTEKNSNDLKREISTGVKGELCLLEKSIDLKEVACGSGVIMVGGSCLQCSMTAIGLSDVREKRPSNIRHTEVILNVNSSPVILNIQPSLCSPSPHINVNQQRLSCSGPVCRICHEDGMHEDLISPCMCAGTLGLAHASCIEKWLSSSNTTSCEICKFQYNLSRRPKSVVQWLQTRSPLNGPSGFCGDVFCLVLLTPLCIGSVYLCAIGARAYIKHGLWEGTGLAMLCCFLMAVYILWCFVAVRFHWKRFRRWQATNKTVHLIDKFCPVKGSTNKIPQVDLSQPYVIT